MLSDLSSHAWPLAWRVLLACVLVLLIYTVALRIHKPAHNTHVAFVAPPRSLYFKQWVPFNSDAVSALAAWRMGLYIETMPESKEIIEDVLEKRCSSLFPGETPATSCYNSTRSVTPPGKALSLVYPGDTSAKVLQKIVDDAAEDAHRDARTQALQDGKTVEEAQVVAVAAEQRARDSAPAEVLTDRLPKYGSWRVEIDRDQLLAKGMPSEPSLTAIAESLSTWLIKIEAVRIVFDDVMTPDDEYDDVFLTVDELAGIDEQFAGVLQTPPASIQSQPGCLKTARYIPTPQSAIQCPWPPMLKLFQVHLGKLLQKGPFDIDRAEDAPQPSKATKRLPRLPKGKDASVRRRPRSPPSGTVPEGLAPSSPKAIPVDVPAPSPDRAREAWQSANKLQQELESKILDTDLPLPEMESYGAARLAQVSEVSRQVGNGYNELFRLRADAKHQLFEHVYDEADSVLHDHRVRQQLTRVLALIKHLLGPEAQAQSVLTDIWRTYMHSALLHSYTIACASLELMPHVCPLRAATAGLPRAVDELKQLSRSQQEDLSALVETVFNMTVPLAPVRPPVMHWDARVQSNGAVLQGAAVEGGADLWKNGTGEPRPDLWVVYPEMVTGVVPRLSLAQVLQRAAIRQYLAFQVWQLDDHAADWGVILQTEDVRPADSHGHIGHYLRSMRMAGRRVVDAKPASEVVDGTPRDTSVGDLLASRLRARLASMDADEQWVSEEEV
eukprot:jgi/Ulvmu1/538/UM001_0546.1